MKLLKNAFRIGQTEQGMTITTAMMAVALFSITCAAILGIIKLSYEMKRLHQNHQTLQSFRDKVYSTLKSDVALGVTIDDVDNLSMVCLRDSTIPCSGYDSSLTAPEFYARGRIKLSDAAGDLVFNSIQTANGFAEDEYLCNNFNSTSGESSCPFSLELKWQVKCVAPCAPDLAPQILVTGKFLFNPEVTNKTLSFNPNWYNFSLLIPPIRISRQARSQKFTAEGDTIWKVPPNVTEIYVQAWGGGGGGGGGIAYAANSFLRIKQKAPPIDSAPPDQFDKLSGGGGGGGAYVASVITVVPEEDLVIRVGAGGTAGDYQNSDSSKRPGEKGGDSWIEMQGTTLVSAQGGRGGWHCPTMPCFVSGQGYGWGGLGGSDFNSIGRLRSSGQAGGNFDEQVDRVLTNTTATIPPQKHVWVISFDSPPDSGTISIECKDWPSATTPPPPSTGFKPDTITVNFDDDNDDFARDIAHRLRSKCSFGQHLFDHGNNDNQPDVTLVFRDQIPVKAQLLVRVDPSGLLDAANNPVEVTITEPTYGSDGTAELKTLVYQTNLYGGRGGSAGGGGGQGGINDQQNLATMAPAVPGGGGPGRANNNGVKGARGAVTIQW